MSKALVIVESPAKAKTINKYLGKDYVVKASMGHVRDLPGKDLGVDIDNDFAPTYEVTKDKVVKELKAAARKADAIYVATDPDREGEAIGWHIAQLLDPKAEKTHRVTFNEITKAAVKAAFEAASILDLNKIDAQQTRRILDRLVGYKISPLLWDKVRRGLSAGRVQSVTLKMVCDRERAIRAFEAVEYWTITAKLEGDQPPQFTCKLVKLGDDKLVPSSQAESDAVVAGLDGAAWTVRSIERKKRRRNPVPPFITSKLQQDAARQLRFSVKKTMRVAQRLYEGVELGKEGAIGLITYMRTDSTRVSDEALTSVRGFIAATYGDDALPAKARSFPSKKRSQDAHEAVRPTSMDHTPESVREFLDRDDFRLYSLIWNRFVASQMKPALYDQTTVEIAAAAYVFRTTGSVLLDKGFLAVYEESQETTDSKETESSSLPPLTEGQELRLLGLEPEQHFTEPPPRYTEAALVKALEENGIGRPSTYAQILATIEKREYTVKDERKFVPTELGFLIADLLTENFSDIVDPGYTARLEDKLDEIEEGSLNWITALREFHDKFDADLTKAKAEMRDVKREEVPTGESCEKCGKPMLRKWGRFGTFVACSGYPECRNTRESEESGNETPAVEAEPCEKCGSEMVVKRGRFGHFLACTGYPKCKNTRRLVKDADGNVRAAAAKILDETCPECSSAMVEKQGRFGPFVACSNYPDCKFIKREEVGVDCPTDGGPIVAKRSKRGRTFYGCANYPKCDWVAWNKPLAGTPCPECNAPFLLERVTKKSGTTHYCANEECKYKTQPVAT